jgi:heme-degrading monooxygenase HmoA
MYTFEVKSDKKADFERSWKELTMLIYEHTGSLGSRLHKTADGTYMAYAQWPSKEVFDNAKSKLPESANVSRQLMKESCDAIRISYELDLVTDLLKNSIFHEM